MALRIGNAPCSWGVEFADDPRNPPWRTVLEQCAAAGYGGIELGPVGYMPEDPALLADALADNQLELIGGVVFRPFHDPDRWDEVMDGAVRTCKAVAAHGAEHLVLIDSISERRAPTAGRPNEADQMSPEEWAGFVERIGTVARMGSQEYGLTVSLHPHAAGFLDFLPEVERILGEIEPDLLKICLDTGHSVYAGFDPLDFMRRHMERISYIHFKSTDADVRARVVQSRTGFYDACASGLFCHLSDGEVDFRAVRELLTERGYTGWCTVEQDCDPAGDTSPVDDARANVEYLKRIGF